MDLSWLQGWSLHSLLLQNMELEKHFRIDMFPPMFVAKLNGGLAEYDHGLHRIRFEEREMMFMLDGFHHVFFHELIHSTCPHFARWDRLNEHFQIVHHDVNDYVNLEERIAEIGAFVLLSMFCDTWVIAKIKKTLNKHFKMYDTKFAIPWSEVEQAVKCYIIKKDCPKLESTLQYYKQVVSEITSVYEGHFNGQLQVKPTPTRTSRINCINARNVAI